LPVPRANAAALPRGASRLQAAGFAALLAAAPVPGLAFPSRGYTLSLLLFVLPSLGVLLWFAYTPREELKPLLRATGLTLAALVPMGIVLNLFFARRFFTYENREAVLGWYVPSLTLSGPDREHAVPAEEFAFYVAGFVAMLLVYVWARESFLRRCSPPPHDAPPRVLGFALRPAAVALGLLGAAWLWKAFGAREPGFPSYLAYLLLLPFVVTLTLYKVARPLVNWQAFALMLSWVLGVSVLWEVSLAIPNGWWGYRREAMAGLYVAPWHDLPVEAVLVWFLAAFATVVTFEAARAFLHHPAPWREALFGARARRGPTP